MRPRAVVAIAFAAALASVSGGLWMTSVHAASHPDARDDFRTSDRCVACHNQLYTKSGEDISIGHQWRASVMANAGRDPYWQASVRRETIDHPEASEEIQDECSTCHMPMQHLINRAEGKQTQVFIHLPLRTNSKGYTPAADGVSCSVCHQVEADGLGTDATYNGNVKVATPADKNHRPEYGPFLVDPAHQIVMQSSTKGFVPTQAEHIRDSGLCGSCHTLYTTARGPGGKAIGRLPEQMPFLEWKHSSFYNNESCQSCHMPQVDESTRVASAFGPEREGMHRHVFLGGNILLSRVLDEHRDELATQATPDELKDNLRRTTEFLQTQAARVTVSGVQTTANEVEFAVRAQNLTGHKLPTAYPSRRAWLHVTVKDAGGKTIFESGALRPDGSIVGNDNDIDKRHFEPHYALITNPDEVEIFEPILGDSEGNVTTGLIAAVKYLKDNRLLPHGFDKKTADHDIAVVGRAADDPNFTGGSSTTRYRIPLNGAHGPFWVEAELMYQPIGFRWAHNLQPYPADETQRWVRYYDENSKVTAVRLAGSEASSAATAQAASADGGTGSARSARSAP